MLDKSQAASISVTTGALPGSKKVYVDGANGTVKVPFREIALHPTADEPPLRVYDTSGPYTDPQAEIDINQGLARPREAWIEMRGDTEVYEGRQVQAADNGFVGEKHLAPEFPNTRKPRRAKPGQNVSQMHYAKNGVITPEMEYVAVRENLRRAQINEAFHLMHEGESIRSVVTF